MEMSTVSCDRAETCSGKLAEEAVLELIDKTYREHGYLTKNLGLQLAIAVEEGNWKVIKAILVSGVSINVFDFFESWLPSLVHAYRNGHGDCVEYICSCDYAAFDFFERETIGDALMGIAVEYNRVDCLKKLLQDGESRGRWSGHCACMQATRSDNTDCLRTLLEAGIGVGIGVFPEVRSVECAKLLLEHGGNVNDDHKGESALTMAVCTPASSTFLSFSSNMPSGELARMHASTIIFSS